jgi:DnaJ-class molecular chaperone
MNYYQTLGIEETASQEDIKSAYKKLAMKNHPDRGGDTKKFQEISQAYDILSDPQKKSEYDARKHRGFNPFESTHSQNANPFEHIHEMFSFHFTPNGPQFGSGFSQQIKRNRDLTIRIGITLKQSYLGTQIEARYNLPNGRSQTAIVDIPPGINHGQTIRYAGLGDDSVPNAPRGNLNVQIHIDSNEKYERINNDLWTTLELTALESMIGCQKEISHLDGSQLPINIRPGVNAGTEFAAPGRGFKDINNGKTGNMYIKIKINMPAVTDPSLIADLEKIYAKINQKS